MNTLENVLKILDENKIEYKKFDHEPVKTSEEAAKVRGVELKTGVKAMLLKTSEEKFIMVLIEADKKVDLKKIAGMENTKKVQFAKTDEVLAETGCDTGAVPPFGHTKNGAPNKIKTYLDKNILLNGSVNFNAGNRTVSVSMEGKDLENVVDYVPF